MRLPNNYMASNKSGVHSYFTICFFGLGNRQWYHDASFIITSISETCLDLLSCGCTSTSCSIRHSECRGKVHHSPGHAKVQKIVWIASFDVDTFIVNVSWCICVFQRFQNLVCLTSLWAALSILTIRCFLEFWYLVAILDFMQQTHYFGHSYMGHELITPKIISNDTNFACFTNTNTNQLPTGLWTKKQMQLPILCHGV